MNLKTCPCCAKPKTTKNSRLLGKHGRKHQAVLWFNCLECGSTFVIPSRRARIHQQVLIQMAAWIRARAAA